jgi:transposase
MGKKRTYSSESVETVRLEVLLPLLMAGCIVALDVAKKKFVVAVTDLAGEVLKLIRFEHPVQTRTFLEVVDAIVTTVGVDKVKAAMEPTGTYGDAIREQLEQRGIAVWMVSPKKTYDAQAIRDDVRSLHDPKSAALVGWLAAQGLATRHQPASTLRVRMRALVDLHSHEFDREERCLGRLEAQLARHWPEFCEWMDPRGQKSALALLEAFPSPARVRSNPAAAEAAVREASRGRLPESKLRGIIDGCEQTLGIAAAPEQEQLIATFARQARASREQGEALKQEMLRVGSEDPVFARLAEWMGPFTAAAVVTLCDPRQYTTSRQLEKACGLNLREKSSGNDRPRCVPLHITKRGPSLVRKLLYLFALRKIHESDVVRAWYMRRRTFAGGAKNAAVVAVMRKLARAMFHVARGQEFDIAKLFDLRRLQSPPPLTEGTTLQRARRTKAAVNAAA